MSKTKAFWGRLDLKLKVIASISSIRITDDSGQIAEECYLMEKA